MYRFQKRNDDSHIYSKKRPPPIDLVIQQPGVPLTDDRYEYREVSILIRDVFFTG